MKFRRKISVLLFTTLAAAIAPAQTNLSPYVQHVIIVIQENRSPDNLFNEDATLLNNGGHVQPNFVGQAPNSGPCLQNQTENYLTLQPNSFGTCWDPDHSHGTHGGIVGAWTTTWHKGAMDQACNDHLWWAPRGGNNYCGKNNEPPYATSGPNGSNACPYTYVDNTFWNGSTPYDRILDPYFQIANQYGFANYMFQTNQGPSFPAHQFLFSGTSAPVSMDHDPKNCGTGNDQFCHAWFAAENDFTNNGQWGCLSNGANIWEKSTPH